MYYDPTRTPPLHLDLDAANREIQDLRRLLFLAHEAQANSVVTIRKLRLEVSAVAKRLAQAEKLLTPEPGPARE